jgi:hypothetical protein
MMAASISSVAMARTMASSVCIGHRDPVHVDFLDPCDLLQLIVSDRAQRIDRDCLTGDILEFLQTFAEPDVGNDELGALVVALLARSCRIALIVPLPAKLKAAGANPASAKSVAPDTSASATVRSLS